jgi:anti-sigma factor RsiW
MARQNDHNRAEELISAYLDKRVSAEEQKFFERHIASCADCRAQLETTRSMIVALKAMPAVKAPRSFVLPREMAKQPQRSFLSLYPALRLATVVAAMAFVVLFAGDLLISRSSGSAPQSIPAAAPAPIVMQAPAARQAVAPTEAPAAAVLPNEAVMATAAPTAPAPAGAAAKTGATDIVTETTAAMLSEPTATPEVTAAADNAMQPPMMLGATPAATAAQGESAQPMLEQQTDSTAAQPAPAAPIEAAPAPMIDPLRVVEIALLALVVVLGIATLVVRRRQA